jgi:hypothetical protein
MSADNSDRIYALIETNSNAGFAELDDHQGVLWRSDNGGDSWRMVNGDHTLVQRPLYYTRALAAPDDHNEVHFLATSAGCPSSGAAPAGTTTTCGSIPRSRIA